MYDLRDLVSIGKSSTISHVVVESDCATKYSKGLEKLLSTPACIRLAIQASADAVDEYLPEGYVSIGRSIEYEHTLSTKVGMKVTVEATVTDVQPRHMVFRITIRDDLGQVGFGSHKRSIVNLESLLKRAENRGDLLINERPL